MQPIRVLHLNLGRLYGGVERYLVTLARLRHLCPEMEPHYAICSAGRYERELRETGVPLYPLGEVRFSRPWNVWAAQNRVKALIAEHRFDVVLCHMPWAVVMFAGAVRQTGTPTVGWAHGPILPDHWLERWARRANPDIWFCCSRWTQNLYPGLRTHLQPYASPAPEGVQTPAEREHIRTELGARPDQVLILIAARMSPMKGHRELVKALNLIKDDPRWHCAVAGRAQRRHDAKYLAEVQTLIARYGLGDRITFIGERSDVTSLMRASDILCQPNRDAEAGAVAFSEAAFAGLPVVSSYLGGAPEIVDDTNGRLTETGNIEQVAAALRELIGSPELRRQLSAAGPPKAKALNDPAIRIPQVGAALAELVRQHRPALSR